MYTAVRMVKMYACSRPTSTSKAVRNSSMKNGRIAIGLSSHCIVSANSIALVSRANVTSSMCPASMLAKSRTARLNGRRMMFDRNSISPTSGRIATGTFRGHNMPVR